MRMDINERDRLFRAIADALSIATDGIMAHFTMAEGETSKDEVPVLFAFTQMRMFELKLEGSYLTLIPRDRLAEVIEKTLTKPFQGRITMLPPQQFDLANPNIFEQIAKYIKGIPHRG